VLKYIKAAFTNRWNLLALMGGVGAAIISGHADVVLPIVLAAEAVYLTMLGSHPKFQSYVEAQAHKEKRATRSKKNQHLLKKMMRALPRDLRERYYQLQQRCQELHGIAADLKHHDHEHDHVDDDLETYQLQSLDRLLWIYLRLLFTYNSLQKFLNKTSIKRIESDIERIEHRLEMIDKDDTSPHTQKVLRTLTDNLATSQDRANNYERARANHEFVELEIDRLENKIKSLSEVAVNRQEPDYVSTQVDRVANSMLETEQTMNELKVFTGLGKIDEDIPPILETVQQTGR
jgi:predicted  nucleic acid-binding Zn-ribbon protein